MGEWKEYYLGDLGVFSGGVTSIKPEDYGFGTPFLPYTNVYRNSKVDVGQLQLMNVNANDLVRKNCLYGDIFFTAASETDDEVAMSSVLLDNVENLTFNGFCKRYRLHDFKTLLPEYARYYFRSHAFRREVFQRVNGDIRYNISQASLKEIPIGIPAIDEQRAIASVLSSLDARIDLLHRQNKTLEGMAEALFRQWFVEEAEEEAAEGTLADVAVNIRDGVPVNAFNSDDRYVALEHIDRRCIALQQFGSSADVASNKYRFAANDILFGKLRPYFHKVCLTSFAGICSTDILVIRPKQPELLYYCLFAFFQDEVVEYANAGSGGTRMPRTSWSDLSKYPIALPGKEKLEAFNNVVKPMMDKLQANIPQIRSLTALRDTMLPKLMCGEVRVEHEQHAHGA